jgi:glyoxylase I family protein
LIRGIHHIALHTPNFDAMAQFYRDAFGFEPVDADFRWSPNPEMDGRMGVAGSAARTQMLKAGNCYIELFDYATPARRGRRTMATPISASTSATSLPRASGWPSSA